MARKLPKTPEAAEKAAKALRENAAKMDKRATDLRNKVKKEKKQRDTCSPKLNKWQRELKTLEGQVQRKKDLIKRNSDSKCKPGRKPNRAA
jgi:peptidoglycan hydrolase CwlO-like protein